MFNTKADPPCLLSKTETGGQPFLLVGKAEVFSHWILKKSIFI